MEEFRAFIDLVKGVSGNSLLLVLTLLYGLNKFLFNPVRSFVEGLDRRFDEYLELKRRHEETVKRIEASVNEILAKKVGGA